MPLDAALTFLEVDIEPTKEEKIEKSKQERERKLSFKPVYNETSREHNHKKDNSKLNLNKKPKEKKNPPPEFDFQEYIKQVLQCNESTINDMCRDIEENMEAATNEEADISHESKNIASNLKPLENESEQGMKDLNDIKPGTPKQIEVDPDQNKEKIEEDKVEPQVAGKAEEYHVVISQHFKRNISESDADIIKRTVDTLVSEYKGKLKFLEISSSFILGNGVVFICCNKETADFLVKIKLPHIRHMKCQINRKPVTYVKASITTHSTQFTRAYPQFLEYLKFENKNSDLNFEEWHPVCFDKSSNKIILFMSPEDKNKILNDRGSTIGYGIHVAPVHFE